MPCTPHPRRLMEIRRLLFTATCSMRLLHSITHARVYMFICVCARIYRGACTLTGRLLIFRAGWGNSNLWDCANNGAAELLRAAADSIDRCAHAASLVQLTRGAYPRYLSMYYIYIHVAAYARTYIEKIEKIRGTLMQQLTTADRRACVYDLLL